MIKYNNLLLTAFLAITISCSSNEFRAVNIDDNIETSLDTSSSLCEAPRSKYTLNTEIVSLEIQSKNNINFGFNAFGWFNFFKTTFIAKKGDFRLEMNITDSLDELKLLALGSGQSVMRQNEFSFSFGIDKFDVSFEQFNQTPLAELTRRGIKNTLNDLKYDFLNNAESWSSVVQAVVKENNFYDIIISSGRSSNLEIGDQLSFYNIEHIWEGEPCESSYVFSRRLSQEPAAIGEVVLIRNHAAQVRVQLAQMLNQVEIGDEVKAFSLNNANKTLKQSLTVKSIENAVLRFENNAFNLTPYLQKQIKGLASDAGFVIYQQSQ